MITNLELDDSLAAQLESVAKSRGLSTRDFIRSALREAVEAGKPSSPLPRFEQKIHDFGTHIESPWTILVDIEGEEYLQKYSRK